MPYQVNPHTGQIEDENGNPVGMAPLDQVLATNAPAQVTAHPRDPVIIDRGNDPGFVSPTPNSQAAVPDVPQAAPPPLPVGTGMTRATSSTTRSREIAAPGEDEALKKVQNDFTKESTLAKREGENLGKVAGIEKTGADQLSNAANETESKLGQTITDQGALVDRAQQQVDSDRKKYDDEREKLSKMKIADYYEGHTGKLIGDAIAVGLGEFGRALSHSGHNSALEIVQSNEKEYYEREKFKIEQQKDIVGNAKDAIGLSQQGISNARLAKADALSNLNLTSAARADAIAASTRAKAAEYGTEHAQIEGEKIANAMDQKRDQYLLAYKQGLRAKVSSESQNVAGTGQGDGTNAKSFGVKQQLATMGVQMQEDMHTITHGPEMTAKDWATVQDNQTKMQGAEQAHGIIEKGLVIGGRMIGYTPRAAFQGLDDEKKKVASAWDLMATKAATVLSASGARESIQELKSQFLPSPSDSPVAVAQKFAYARSMAAVAMQGSGQLGVNAQAAADRANAGPGLSPPPSISDDEAIKLARQRLQANPNDEKAKRVLQLHGVQ